MVPIASAQALPDILGYGLKVVFCGINPGIDAAKAGHHFLGRGNRFWPVLYLAGFTPHQIMPQDDKTALEFGLGLTTVVSRPTNRADQIATTEFAAAASALLQKLERYQPRYIAFLGKAAYLGITGKRDVAWGEQSERFGATPIWILPNPSGLNRGYTKEQLVDAYAALNRALSPG